MPRIEDRLLKATLYLYKSDKDAEDGKPGGSGFLVGEPCSIPDAVYLFAVTNSHVVEYCPVVRTAGRGSNRVVNFTTDEWFPHPGRDDLVVAPIGFAPKDDPDYRLGYVPRDWFATPDHFTEANDEEGGKGPIVWPYGAGEDVLMVGRFLGHDGKDENEPVARFGHLATGHTLPIEHPWGFAQDSFLVECRSVTGYSGSPVYVHRHVQTIGAGPAPLGSEQSQVRLLGVDWGNLDRVALTSYSIDWSQGTEPGAYPPGSGMMVAVPAWRLAELLDSAEVQDLKKEAEDDQAKRNEGVNLD